MEPENTSDSLAIEMTVMAIREAMMRYFKGNCVDPVTSYTNVTVYPKELSLRGMPNVQRVQIKRNNAHKMYISRELIFEMGMEPMTVTFNSPTLNRSKQLRSVSDQILKFLDKYLPDVEIKHIEEEIDDVDLINATKLQEPTDVPDIAARASRIVDFYGGTDLDEVDIFF